MKSYDITIIGAGPSGATLARLLSKRYRVLLVDKRSFHLDLNAGDKCCGGLLAPDAQEMLATLGLAVPRTVLTGPQSFTVKTIDFDNNLERYYQRHYINVDREKFDAWLISLIGENVESSFSTLYKSYEELGDGTYKVNLHNDGSKYSIMTRVIIGADGALSLIRKHAYGKLPIPSKYASVQEWFHVENGIPYFASIFDQEVTDFYSWMIQKEELLIVGSAIPAGPEVNEKFVLLKQKLRKHGYNFGKRLKRHGTVIFRPQRNSHIQLGGGKIALVGEAAGFISPSSAEGISYALKSAVALADALNGNIDCFASNYRKKSKSLRRNVFFKRLKSIVMYTPFIRKLVMQSRLLSMKVLKN